MINHFGSTFYLIFPLSPSLSLTFPCDARTHLQTYFWICQVWVTEAPVRNNHLPGSCFKFRGSEPITVTDKKNFQRLLLEGHRLIPHTRLFNGAHINSPKHAAKVEGMSHLVLSSTCRLCEKGTINQRNWKEERMKVWQRNRLCWNMSHSQDNVTKKNKTAMAFVNVPAVGPHASL